MKFECDVPGCKFVAARHAAALAHVQAHKRIVEIYEAYKMFQIESDKEKLV